jgi:hypothetical protein
MIARTSAPNDVTTHPTSDTGPNAANDAGSRKIPDPIMLPTTRAVHAAKPSLPDTFSAIVGVALLSGGINGAFELVLVASRRDHWAGAPLAPELVSTYSNKPVY